MPRATFDASDFHRRLDAFCEDIARSRWLEPDASMAALDAEARAFITERVDEHAAALAAVSPGAEALALEVWITRSPKQASVRWFNAWTGAAEDSVPRMGVAAPAIQRDPVSTRWCAALDAWEKQRARHVAGLGDRAREAMKHFEPQLRRALKARAKAPSAASRAPFSFEVIGYEAVVRTATAVVLAGLPTALSPGPWAPLLALWGRGVWPFGLPRGRLGLYVPVHVGGALVDPGLEDEPRALTPSTWPTVPPIARASSYADPVSERLGFFIPATARRNTTIMRGPLPPPELPDEP